jgi:ribosomal protein L11 methyltransferase
LKYPALDVAGIESDFLLALVDDFGPHAVDTHDSLVTIFFTEASGRDRARDAVMRAHPDVVVNARDVDDEDWAARSQANLTPVIVGRITVAPPWAEPATGFPTPHPPASGVQPSVVIVIAPSMGFGTGHHATTRLCLRALQELDLTESRVLDVGTGSGVLAIAARMLGAREAIGIDDDRDAIHSAMENLTRNPGIDHVTFEARDLRTAPLSPADVITANLTGALLVRSANLLVGALTPHGSLIVSGLQTHEREDVVRAFGQERVVWEAVEDDWVGLIVRL